MPPYVGEEELEAVGGAGDRFGLDRHLRLRGPSLSLGRAQFESERLQLAAEVLDILFTELVLERERLELDRVHELALLRTVEERSDPIGFQQLLKLRLRHLWVVLSRLNRNLSHSLFEGTQFALEGRFPGR